MRKKIGVSRFCQIQSLCRKWPCSTTSLLEPALTEDLDFQMGLFPMGFCTKSIADWSTSTCTMARPGLVSVLGHVERGGGGETAARN